MTIRLPIVIAIISRLPLYRSDTEVKRTPRSLECIAGRS